MTANLFNLSGKNIILTGGLGLLGREYLRALAEYGAIVHVIDVLPAAQGETIVQPFSHATYHQADITKREDLERVCGEVLKQSATIDVLINNAALNPKVEAGNQARSASQRFEDLDIADWNREIGVNLTGAVLACQVFGSAMSRGASIINASSIYGVVGPDQRIYPPGFFKPATYGVTKGGLIALTKYLATYWGEKGIRVNCMVLGGVENSQDPEFIRKYVERTPLGRMARPHDYSGLIVYLASDASSYATGSIFTVDGGWTAW